MMHHQRSICCVGISRCVLENYLGFAATLNHLLTVLYFLWDLFFVSFCFFFSLVQWLWVRLFKAKKTPTRDVAMEENFEQSKTIIQSFVCIEHIFIFACIFWIYFWQICLLFYTTKRPLSLYIRLDNCYTWNVHPTGSLMSCALG